MVEVEEQRSINRTDRDAAIELIAKRLGVQAERGRRFSELTSLRVGGAIDWLLSPQIEAQAAALIKELERGGIAWRPLGSGSNVLADDGEHHYVIISLKDLKADPIFAGNRVSVSAGYSLPRLCIDAARQGLSGIEGLNGIPGTLGGALWMNAGAYGQEIGIVVERKGRVAVMAIGARGEALAGQTAGKGCQLALPGGRLEVHRRAHRADQILRL